jgi:hypothetical protein
MFLDTHDPYNAAAIPWPVLPQDALARLRGLPFWGIAVETEGQAAARIAALAKVEHDPLLREAIDLQAFEEARHQHILEAMLRHYDIPLYKEPTAYITADPEWEFLRMGYAECFDSFFAFGLFHLANTSGFFPAALVQVFEPIMQELGGLQPGTACLVAPPTLRGATPGSLCRASLGAPENGPKHREQEFHLCGSGYPACGANIARLPQDVSCRKRPSPQHL